MSRIPFPLSLSQKGKTLKDVTKYGYKLGEVKRERMKLQGIFLNGKRCSTKTVTFETWLNFTPPQLVLHFMEYSRNIPRNIPYSKIMNI